MLNFEKIVDQLRITQFFKTLLNRKYRENLCGSKVGCSAYWKSLSCDLLILAKTEEDIVGFMIIDYGFRCVFNKEQDKFSYSNDNSDTWKLSLICGAGFGMAMMTFLKKEARSKGIRFLTLFAVVDKIGYYWKKHGFQVTVGCKHDERVSAMIQVLNTRVVNVDTTEQDLKALLKVRAEQSQAEKRKSAALLKARKSLNAEAVRLRDQAFLEIARLGYFEFNFATVSGPNLTLNEDVDADDILLHARDGIYMTLCLDHEQSKSSANGVQTVKDTAAPSAKLHSVRSSLSALRSPVQQTPSSNLSNANSHTQTKLAPRKSSLKFLPSALG